jgi:predicted ribonuclease YlaK
LPSKKVFVDTNVLLNQNFNFSDYGLVKTSIISVEELDGLKKSPEIGYQARAATQKLKNANNVEVIIDYDFSFENRFLSHRADNFILGFAYQAWREDNEYQFITDDFNLYIKAHAFNIPCDLFEFKDIDLDTYKGYKIITMSPQEMSNHYTKPSNIYGLLNNEFLLIKDEDGVIVDQQRWNSEQGFLPLSKKGFNSKYLDEVKPKDAYQMMAIDSLNNMDFTLLFGVAGSAKSLLSLSWIMQSIQTQKINKCVVIYNSVSLKNSQAQGYYPGDRNQKLLQTSLGGILSSKFGSMAMVEDLIVDGKLLLIPTSEIRGIEVSENDCVFVTEAQNIDAYTMRTILQRAKGKVIVEGDMFEQRDLKSNIQQDNGMLRAIEVFKGTKYFSCVKLKNTYRSPMCELAQQI